MFLLGLALAVEPAKLQVAVDAAGQLSVPKDLRTEEPTPERPVLLQAKNKAGDVDTLSLCEQLQLYQFQKVGCGTCTDSCNKYGGKVDTASSSSMSYSEPSDCYNTCKNSTTCQAISFDGSSNTCTLHSDLPHGAWCDDDGCGVHPDDTLMSAHSSTDRMSSCDNKVCMVSQTHFADDATVLKLGAGACTREFAEMTMYAQYVVTTAGWSSQANALSSWRTTCKEKCEADEDANGNSNGETICRSYNVGVLQQCGSTGCTNMKGVCQLFNVSASAASTEQNTMKEQPCSSCSLTGAAALGISCSQCATSEMECHVRTARASADILRRGEGYCQNDDGTTPTVLATQTYTSVSGCMDACETMSNCVGGSVGTTSGGHASSYCTLYGQGTYSGKAVSQSSLEALALDLCDDCKSTDTVTKPKCPCSNSPLYGWCSTCTHETCDGTACADCRSCMESFSSECFANSRV